MIRFPLACDGRTERLLHARLSGDWSIRQRVIVFRTVQTRAITRSVHALLLGKEDAIPNDAVARGYDPREWVDPESDCVVVERAIVKEGFGVWPPALAHLENTQRERESAQRSAEHRARRSVGVSALDAWRVPYSYRAMHLCQA